MTNKKAIIQLALATLIGMPLIAIIIDRFSERVDLASTIMGIMPLWKQVLYGIISGGVAAVLAQLIIDAPFMRKVNVKYIAMLGGIKLSWSDIIFVAFCAGVGEELLFRGAIQPIMGIAWTAVFFVAIHGYLNPRDWRISVYGVFMTVVISVLGWLTEISGILTAMIAHTIIDIWLLYKLQIAAAREKEIVKDSMNDNIES